jgi:thymidylate synthase (FAD)
MTPNHRTGPPATSLRVWKVAETRYTLPDADEAAWRVWSTDSLHDAEKISEFAGRLCYQSWNNPSGRGNAQYLRNIIGMAHFSVLEHAGFSVVLTGISRALTHEFVRHRHLSPSQLSQRFFNEEDAAVVVPPLYRDDPEALQILDEVYTVVMDAYRRLNKIGQVKLDGLTDRRMRRKRAREAARAVLPNMIETHIVMTGNHRSWREFFEKRGSAHADAEIREAAVRIFAEVAQPMAPAIYQDFRDARQTL